MTPYHRCFPLVVSLLIAIATRSPISCTRAIAAEQRLWCHTIAPDPSGEQPMIDHAVARMRAIGGTCANLANTISSLLAQGRVHLYDRAAYPTAGAVTPVGLGAASWMLVSRDLVARYFDVAHRSGNVDSRGVPRPQTLQLVLAHEADHVNGEGHTDPDGYLTKHTMECSDLRLGLRFESFSGDTQE